MAIGDWVGLYGSAGYWLPGGHAADAGTYDDWTAGLGAHVTDAAAHHAWMLGYDDGDDRALQTPDGAHRGTGFAWVDVGGGFFEIELAFPDGFFGTIHLYYAGWDAIRPQRMTLAGVAQESTVGEGQNGHWFHFAATAAAPGETLTLTVQSLIGPQPLINGIFFDGDPIEAVIRPTGIPSGAAVGEPDVPGGALRISPAGIPSAVEFGGFALLARPSILPAGIASAAAVGVPTIELAGTTLIEPAGIGSGAVVGTPTILQDEAPFAVPHNRFVDRSTGEVYPWPVNHTAEESIKSLGRRLTRTGIGRGGLLVRQPEHPGPTHLILRGSMIDRDQTQYRTFVRFFNACDDRTIDYIDATGDSYEVVITQFDAHRKMSPARLDGSYFEYTLEVEVLAVNQGALKGYA